VKNLTWQNPGQLFVAQELIKIVKLKCCGIKVRTIIIPNDEYTIDNQFSLFSVVLLDYDRSE